MNDQTKYEKLSPAEYLKTMEAADALVAAALNQLGGDPRDPFTLLIATAIGVNATTTEAAKRPIHGNEFDPQHIVTNAVVLALMTQFRLNNLNDNNLVSMVKEKIDALQGIADNLVSQIRASNN